MEIVKNLSPASYTLAVPLILSVLYSTFEIRHRIDPHLFDEVRRNIERRLFSLRNKSLVPDSDFESLCEKSKLFNLFWKLIDNEKSLEKKSGGVMMNGLFVTSFQDAFVVLLLTAPFGVIYAYWSAGVEGVYRNRVVLTSAVLVLLAILCRTVFLPRVKEKHLKLSNEQLDYIEGHLRKEAGSAVDNLWRGLREA